MLALRPPLPHIIRPRGYAKPDQFELDPNHPLNRGLIGCWPLGRGAKIETDLSIHGNHGTLTLMDAEPRVGSHHGGLATAFDGTDGYIALGTPKLFDFTGKTQITLCAWAYLTDTNQSDPPIIAKQSGSTGQWRLAFGTGTNKLPALHLNFAGVWSTAKVAAVSALSVNTWYHICATYDGDTARMYINGVQVNTGAHTSAISNETADPIYIGTNGFGNYFEGQLEGIRIYDRAITAEEVKWLSSEPYAGLMPALSPYLVGVVAGGGVVIPIFRHHYHMQGAA